MRTPAAPDPAPLGKVLESHTLKSRAAAVSIASNATLIPFKLAVESTRVLLDQPPQKMNGDATSVTDNPMSATENPHATVLYTRPFTCSPMTLWSLMMRRT